MKFIQLGNGKADKKLIDFLNDFYIKPRISENIKNLNLTLDQIISIY